jgi:hypothetical protein
MTWDDVFWHLINFALPALAVSLGITAWGAFQFRRQPRVRWFWRWLINLVGGLAVLVAGLVLTGNDGKMATYGVLVLVCATLEWGMQLQFLKRG